MDLPERKSLRLKSYDYSQAGYYFITLCTHDKKCILSRYCRGEHCSHADSIPHFELTDIGIIVDIAIKNIPQHYQNAVINKYVIMPNHVHVIIVLNSDGDGRTLFAPTISRIIKQMKEYVTKQVGYPIWQKSFYDHVIREEMEYEEIWQYIENNPLKWELDKYYCKL